MRRSLLAALVLALALPASASAAGYASPGGDIELRMSGETVELVRGGEVVASDSAGAQWVIQGSDDVDDTLTVRNPDGGVVPAHVTFAGGDGAGVDALNVEGGRSDSGAASATGPDSGSILHTRGPDTLAVTYSGLEPVMDTISAPTLTVDYSGGDDTITIDDGVAPADGRLRVDTPTTEEIEFANKTNVTVNGNGGTDTVTIDNAEAATGLTGTMTVNTGTEMGESISVDDANYTGATLMLQTSGGIVDMNGGANNVTANAFGAHAGNGIVLNTTVSNLEVDTDTGPLAIFNTGAVTVGGVSSTLHGLRVGGDSTGGDGSVDLTAGAITLNDATGPEAVRSGFSSGSVSLVATGAFSTTASQPAARAPVGSIGVSATGFAIAAGSTFSTFFPCTFVATGTDLDLGGTGAGAALSDTELDQVSAGILLVVGNNVTNTAAVSIDPTRAASLGLTATTGGITQTASAGITAQRLVVNSISGTTNLAGSNNDVDSLEGSTQSVTFSDQDGLTIPAQLRATTGALVVQANGNMTANAPVKADAGLVDLAVLAADGTFDNNAAITGTSAVLRSDRMALEGGSVNVGTGTLGLQPQSSAQKFDLGSATDAAADTTELSDAELDTLTAGVVRVGAPGAGSIAVTGAVSLAPAKVPALTLITGGTITQTASLTVAALRTQSAGATTLNGANDVDKLAGATTGVGSAWAFTDVDGLDIDTVDTRDGVSTVDGAVNLTSAGCSIASPVTAGGSHAITLTSSASCDQVSAGDLHAQQLKFSGAGPFAFTGATSGNGVATFASDATGTVTLVNTTALTIGTVGGVDGVTGASSASIQGSDLTVSKAVSSPTVQLSTASGGKLTNNSDVSGSSVDIGGDKMALGGGTVTGTTEVNVVLGTDFTSDTSVDLGSTTDSATNTVELSDAELDTITAPAANFKPAPGSIHFYHLTSEVSPAHVTKLRLDTGFGGGSIEDNHTGNDVTVPELITNSRGSTTLDTTVSNFAGTAGLSGALSIHNTGDLTINGESYGIPQGLGISATGDLTVAQSVYAGGNNVSLSAGPGHTLTNNSSISSDRVFLTADRMVLGGGTVDKSNGSNIQVGLDTVTAGHPIDLGATSDAAGSLKLSDAELDTITADALEIGHQNSGPLTVSQPVSPAHSPVLKLFADGFAGPGSVAVPTLSFNDTGSTGRTWTLDSTAVNDGPPIPYSGVTNLTVNGGSGADTFDVKASPTTAYAIIGGDPGSSPGDTLNYDDEGRGAGGDTTAPDGNITSPGVQDVFFSQIERTHFEGIDADDDGVPNTTDNCAGVANPDQADLDKDGIGDACDPHPDVDGDGVDDPVDNCVNAANPGQADQDGDKAGDACDPDADGDGFANVADNCPAAANPEQTDFDHDGIGRPCDPEDLALGSCQNVLTGTNGPDTLNGTPAGDVIDAGPGDDVIHALAGNDCPTGGTGHDSLFGGPGADRIRGGTGNDFLSGGGGDDRFMRGQAGKDRLAGGAGDDGLAGGPGNDKLSGGPGDDYLSGGAGNDRINGGGGHNGLFGRAGRDRINARNGVSETVSCGTGDDTATVDRNDRVQGCEHVLRPPATAP